MTNGDDNIDDVRGQGNCDAVRGDRSQSANALSSKSDSTGIPVGPNGSSAFRGVFTILKTPFNSALEIDEERLLDQVDFLVRCGVHGIVWPAASSELMGLTREERLEFGRKIVERASGRLPVILAISSCHRKDSELYARHAWDCGASGLLTLPLMDYQSTDPALFAEYLTSVSHVTPLPIFVQPAYPGQGSSLTPAFLIQLAKRIPTFRYVKEEQHGQGSLPARIGYYRDHSGGLIRPMAGAGARNFMNELGRGSWGTMCGPGFADIQVAIWEAFESSDHQFARELFGKMLMMAVLESAVGYAIQKEILCRRGIFTNSLMRHTRRSAMDEGDLKELDAIYDSLSPYFRT